MCGKNVKNIHGDNVGTWLLFIYYFFVYLNYFIIKFNIILYRVIRLVSEIIGCSNHFFKKF